MSFSARTNPGGQVALAAFWSLDLLSPKNSAAAAPMRTINTKATTEGRRNACEPTEKPPARRNPCGGQILQMGQRCGSANFVTAPLCGASPLLGQQQVGAAPDRVGNGLQEVQMVGGVGGVEADPQAVSSGETLGGRPDLELVAIGLVGLERRQMLLVVPVEGLEDALWPARVDGPFSVKEPVRGA